MTVTRTVPSPLGDLLLVGDGETLRGLYFPDHQPAPRLDAPVLHPEAFEEAVRQLDEWFAGARTRFELKLDLQGTHFQLGVWDALARVPFGRTVTYREVRSEELV